MHGPPWTCQQFAVIGRTSGNPPTSLEPATTMAPVRSTARGPRVVFPVPKRVAMTSDPAGLNFAMTAWPTVPGAFRSILSYGSLAWDVSATYTFPAKSVATELG